MRNDFGQESRKLISGTSIFAGLQVPVIQIDEVDAAEVYPDGDVVACEMAVATITLDAEDGTPGLVINVESYLGAERLLEIIRAIRGL